MDVTVRTEEILSILRANRAKHRANFEAALDEYAAQLMAWHEEQVARIRAGKRGSRSVTLPEPEDHTDDYDTMIKMMEMEVNPTVTIDFHTFQNLAMDQWPWSGRFFDNTMSYVSGR